MRAYFMFTGSGPIVILTSYDSIKHPELLKILEAKGIKKFVASEVPLDLAKSRYGVHYDVVLKSLQETDDLRVLDYSGQSAFNKFKFKELGKPIYNEAEE